MSDKPVAARQRPTENPRTSRMRAAVLTAVIELVLSEGAGAVTPLRVSDHAGVARSTIYNHWPTANALLLDAIDQITTPHAPTVITGDLETDLVTTLTGLRQRLSDQPFLTWFATLLDQANREHTFVAAQQRFVNGVLQPLDEVLTAAQERHELAPGSDVATVAAQLAAPILTQHVMLRSTTSDAVIDSIAKRFLNEIQHSR